MERLDSHIEDAKSEGDFSYIKPFEIAKIAVQKVAEEYNDGWIPCSERLPEENGLYLIFDNRGMIYESTYLTNMWLIATSATDVIAWQPLPEPYKEGEHEATDVF